MLYDRYGLPVSTNSAEARDAYVEAVDFILASNAGAPAALDRAIAADPGFGLPHAANARVLQLQGDVAGARAAADRARDLMEGATGRERRHAEIFHRLVNGQGQGALALLREHLDDAPRDALALSPACGVFGLIGFSGRIGREPEQLDLLEPLVEAYGDDWWFLTSYSFALTEMGHWDRGRACVERALTIHPRSGHTAHVYAHALYEAGENQTALRFLEPWLPEYDAHAPLHCHLWWHLALLHLMEGDIDGMWTVYDTHCAPAVSASPPINVLSDGVSLLWRAGLASGKSAGAGDAETGRRWQALCAYGEQKFAAPMVFVDVHHSLSLAVNGPGPAFEDYIRSLETMGEAGKLPAGEVPAGLARAFSAYQRSDWSDAIDRFESLWPSVVRIGGSRAQRNLVRNTLLAAYVRDGRPEAARAFLDRVEDRRPATSVHGLAAA